MAAKGRIDGASSIGSGRGRDGYAGCLAKIVWRMVGCVLSLRLLLRGAPYYGRPLFAKPLRYDGKKMKRSRQGCRVIGGNT